MGMSNNRVFFRGHDRNFYDGKRALRYDAGDFFNKILPWEKNATIFDNELSFSFDEYYNAFIDMGFMDIASDGVNLDTPIGAFGYIVGADGEAYSMIAKIDDRNWLHIYHGDLLFEDLDNGRDFLSGVYKFREMGAKGGTLSAISMNLFKREKGRNFGAIYPDCKKMLLPTGENVYKYLEKSYRTGWNYLKKEYEGQAIKNSIIYDVNSLYPYIFSCAPMPYGAARYGEGAPTETMIDFFKQGKIAIYLKVRIDFELKENHLPFITLAKSEAPRTAGAGEIVLTYQELCLMYQQYDINSIEFIDYVYFNAAVGENTAFVNKYYKLKEQSQGMEKKVYKGILNYLTGTFAKKQTRHNLIKTPNGWEMVANELNEASLLYLGFSITSWGRYKIVSGAQKHYDTFIYSDTDSLHLTEVSETIAPSRALGGYKVEAECKEACYKKRKWYGYRDRFSKVHLVTAGVPSADARQIEKQAEEKNTSIKELMDLLTN